MLGLVLLSAPFPLVERAEVEIAVLPQKLFESHPLQDLLAQNLERARAGSRAGAHVSAGQRARRAPARFLHRAGAQAGCDRGARGRGEEAPRRGNGREEPARAGRGGAVGR